MEFDSRAWAKNWRDKNNEGRLEREKEREQECLQEFSRSRPILPSFSPRTISERSTSERLEQARGHNSYNFFCCCISIYIKCISDESECTLTTTHDVLLYFRHQHVLWTCNVKVKRTKKNLPLVLQHCFKTSWKRCCASDHQTNYSCLATNQVVARYKNSWCKTE